MIQEDTISAITTAPGSAAIGIVRISGPEALRIAERMFFAASGRELATYPPHVMVYGFVRDREGKDIDEVLTVYMKGPRSYTAEDVVEIQCHGGMQSLRQILALTFYYGARPAEPGEFTKRAFLNGRIDLVQAESVMDIINSRSTAALKIAVQQQEGFLSRKLKEVRRKLRDVIVHLEAVIDYPEEDIEDVTYKEVKESICDAKAEVASLLEGAHTGKILKEGLRTAIIGRPNVGKSSLLNTLLKEDRALVSEYEGTTRDVIEEQLVIGGVPVLLADTAGIRDTEDFVEKLGVERSRAFLDKAELILVVLDGTQPLTPDDEEILTAVKGKNAVLVVNKADLAESIITQTLAERFSPENIIEVSAKTGEGIELLEKWLKDYVYGSSRQADEEFYIQNERQINLLRQADESLADAVEAAENRLPYDCLTIDVDRALTLMGEITGETVRDEIINEIFARFCVGK